jgi:hypothetical protein
MTNLFSAKQRTRAERAERSEPGTPPVTSSTDQSTEPTSLVPTPDRSAPPKDSTTTAANLLEKKRARKDSQR